MLSVGVIYMQINYKRQGNKVVLTVLQTELYRQPNKKKPANAINSGRIKKNTKIINRMTFPDFETALAYGNELYLRNKT